jgi:hypothetical protein
MFRAPLCPSSGARQYYTSDCCLSYLVLGFQVVGIVWSLAVVCPVCGLQPANRTHILCSLVWAYFWPLIWSVAEVILTLYLFLLKKDKIRTRTTRISSSSILWFPNSQPDLQKQLLECRRIYRYKDAFVYSIWVLKNFKLWSKNTLRLATFFLFFFLFFSLSSSLSLFPLYLFLSVKFL